jgi:siroheme synthase (precorrin-2 oxidase/ferrochelatase)
VKENASVTLISPKTKVPNQLLEMATIGDIAWFNREFRLSDLDGKYLVINNSADLTIKNSCLTMGITYFDGSSHFEIAKQ